MSPLFDRSSGSHQGRRGAGGGAMDGRGGDTLRRGSGDGFQEDEAELKVRTALRRMGKDGVSRAWEEFERMDPGGERRCVREDELVEVR